LLDGVKPKSFTCSNNVLLCRKGPRKRHGADGRSGKHIERVISAHCFRYWKAESLGGGETLRAVGVTMTGEVGHPLGARGFPLGQLSASWVTKFLYEFQSPGEACGVPSEDSERRRRKPD